MKSWLSQQVLTHPKRLIIVNVLFTLLFAYGLKWLVIDDNFMNMLPKDIESRRVWEEVETKFGASEIMFIAFGNSGTSIYHKESFKTVWDLTELIKQSPYVDEVIAIPTMNRMDSEDGFMEVDDLFPDRDLDIHEISFGSGLNYLIQYILFQQFDGPLLWKGQWFQYLELFLSFL